MRGIQTVAIVGLAILISGCIQEAPTNETVATQAPDFQFEDDRITIQSTNVSNIDWVPTILEPPQLVVGEYWTIKMNFGTAAEERVVDIVVAGQEEEFWLIGMPTHDFDNRIMVFHLPGMGQITKATLGFEAHDVWLDPLQFPLEMGDKWVSGLMGANNVAFEVTDINGLNVTITGTSNTFPMTIVYDATIRGIRSMNVQGYGSYEVLEHGFDWHEAKPEWEGQVTVPHMSDLILCHGRIAGAAEIDSCGLGSVDGPEELVEIDSQYDRVSFANILRAETVGTPGGPKPGTYYEVTTTAPDGTVYKDSMTLADGVSQKVIPYKHDAPGGTWRITAVAGGPGQAFAEGIGYHVYDVDIASGRILPSVGEHQHGDDGEH